MQSTRGRVRLWQRAACAMVFLAGCGIPMEPQPLPQDPYGWNGEGGIIQFAYPGDSDELRRGFAKAKRGEVYFGALHVDYESERYAYARNWNSLEAAITVTSAVCAADAGRSCTLALVILPDALPPETRRAKGFSVQTLHQFRLNYSRVQKPGLWGAYAISPLAAQGFSARESSERDARQIALENCRFRLDAELAQLGRVGASAARKAGLDRCEVVHVTRGSK